MTGPGAFSEEEWKTILVGPTTAGMIVITAAKGGTFRETYSMAKAYAEARSQHGASELLDAIVSHRPESDHTRYSSPDEMRSGGLEHIREAVALLQRSATPAEVDEYRSFVLALARRVAAAHEEDGSNNPVNPAEQAVIDQIAAALGASAGSQAG
jgi:hypothetical protein